MAQKNLEKKLLNLGLCLFMLLAIQLLARAQALPGKLVKTDWLATNLSNPDVRVIDMRSDIRDYWIGHIPGSVYLDSAILHWPDQGVPSKLLSPEALAILLGQMGITENTSVIVYYDKNGYPPFYLLWALDYLGHKSSALLEDGIELWKKEGRSLTQDYPKIKPVRYKLAPKLRTEIRATLEDVIAESNAGAVLVDARPQELYNGGKGAWKRKGHIKGAVSHFWALDMNTDGTWKTKQEIMAGYEKIGVTPDKDIIIYCGHGQMSVHTYFCLKHILGFPKVKVYDGGFSEWSNRDDLAVEPGI